MRIAAAHPAGGWRSAVGAGRPGRGPAPERHRAAHHRAGEAERRAGRAAVRRQLRELPWHRRIGHRVPAPRRRRHPRPRAAAARRGGAGGRLLPAHRLHAAVEPPRPAGQRPRSCSRARRSRRWSAYVASLGPGPAIPHPDPGAGSIAEGTQLFTLHCAGCHQELARGGFVTGAQVPPLQTVSATQIAEAVRIGPYLMPRFPRSEISDAQLNSIVKYVLSTRHPDNRGGWGIGNLGPIPEGLVTWWIAAPLLLLVLPGRRKEDAPPMKLWQWLFALIFGRLLRRHRASAEPGRRPPSGSCPPARRSARRRTSSSSCSGSRCCSRSGSSSPTASSAAPACPTRCWASASARAWCASARRSPSWPERLVVTEELEDDYPSEHPEQQQEITEIVHESGIADHPQAAAHRRRRGGGRDARAGRADPGALAGPGVGHRAAGPDAVAARGAPRRRLRHAAAGAGHPPSELLHRVPRGRRPRADRRLARRHPPGPRQAAPPRRARGVGAGRDHGLLQDLHPRRLRGRAVSQSDVPGGRAVTRRWCARATTRPSTRSPAGR